MNKCIFFLFFIWEIISAATSPLISSIGYSCRSGEVKLVLGSSSTYDFSTPYTSTFSSSSISLALSMVDYYQSFDSSYKVYYHLYENTPSLSNSSHAIFRVYIGYLSLTSRAKVKYLACPTSILSQNFNIIVFQVYPGVLNSGVEINYTVTTSLNTDSSYSYAIWMSGMQASKNSSSAYYHIYNSLYSSPYRIRVYNYASTPITIDALRVTLVFIHNSVATISDGSGSYSILYMVNFYSHSTSTTTNSLKRGNSWLDAHIICGFWDLYFTNLLYEYSMTFCSNALLFLSSLTGAPGYEFATHCFIAASRVCPNNYPYY